MAAPGRRVRHLVGSVYSVAADTFYDRVIARGTLPLLGGDIDPLIIEQGRRAVEIAGGEPILDMPVGTAYFTARIAAGHSGLVVGTDLAEGMVRKAAEVSRRAGADNVIAVRGDAHHLPFRDGAFRAVLCANGLPVIPGLKETLSELARVLSTDGALLITMVTVPVGGLLPAQISERFPAAFKSKRDMFAALSEVGLEVSSFERSRLAMLIEARPAGPR